MIAVGHEPRTYSMHAVLTDLMLAASLIARDLVLAGHRRIAAVEAKGSTILVRALCQAAGRYSVDATVDVVSPEDLDTLFGDRGQGQVSAVVCESAGTARLALAAMERHGAAAPRDVTIAAIGNCAGGDEPCSGYYFDCQKISDSVVELLRDPPVRPATLWIAGEYVDRGTTAPVIDGGSGATDNACARSDGLEPGECAGGDVVRAAQAVSGIEFLGTLA